MKNRKYVLILLMGFTLRFYSQSPSIEWQKSFGGSGNDSAQEIDLTNDGGYVVAGFTNSTDGDLTFGYGDFDYWILKLDGLANIQWQKVLGGSKEDQARSIRQALDGGYIVAGNSKSDNNDVFVNFGQEDFWIVRLDESGGLLWERTYGGSDTDMPFCVENTTDFGFVVVGQTFSFDNNINNHGGSDYWVLKLDSFGNILWQQTLGGTNDDIAQSVIQTSDLGFIVVGQSASIDGDITESSGSNDMWVVKLDVNGNMLWQKSFGGSSSDNAFSVEQTNDEGFIISGFSNSTDGDVSGNQGVIDFWIIKLDLNGNLVWQKMLGGNLNDWSWHVEQTCDGGYLVSGHTFSTQGQVTENNGQDDYWLVKLNSEGNIIWEKSLGGSGYEEDCYALEVDCSHYIVSGVSTSNDGDVNGNHGGSDFWLAKLELPSILGCTYALADNYNPLATVDNGSCTFVNLANSCCKGDFTDDSIINTTDLLIFLSVFGSSCP